MLLTLSDDDRWQELAVNSAPPLWKWRNRLIAGLLPNSCTLIDIGCGNKNLKEFLPPSIDYTGLDYIGDDRIIVDLNDVENIPMILDEHYDVAVISGVLEHIQYPWITITHAYQWADTVVMTWREMHSKRNVGACVPVDEVSCGLSLRYVPHMHLATIRDHGIFVLSHDESAFPRYKKRCREMDYE